MKRINWISNGLIVVGLLGIVYVYFPLIKAELSYRFAPQTIQAYDQYGDFSIAIPKLRVVEDITANVDPFNRSEYESVLRDSIAHAKNSAMPGEGKSVYLFAHSSANPWEMTRTNTPFLLLHKLEKGDTITIDYNKSRYTYRVTKKETVSPSDTEALLQGDTNQLILQTCTPLGTDLNRLLIFAEPV